MIPQVGNKARFKIDSSGIFGRYFAGHEFLIERVHMVNHHLVVSFKIDKAPYDEWIWTDDRFEVIE